MIPGQQPEVFLDSPTLEIEIASEDIRHNNRRLIIKVLNLKKKSVWKK